MKKLKLVDLNVQSFITMKDETSLRTAKGGIFLDDIDVSIEVSDCNDSIPIFACQNTGAVRCPETGAVRCPYTTC